MIPKADEKNVELRRLVGHLRDHIDVYRIIGINHDALKDSSISNAFLGHLQKSAHESAALIICKIFESSQRNDLNSIPGVIECLQPNPIKDSQATEFTVFGEKYGNCSKPTEVKAFLLETFELFCGIHSRALDQFKEFRDKIAAHSDFNAEITALGSLNDFEAFFGFANDFYLVVSHSIHGVEPGEVEPLVGRGLMRLIKAMGITDPKFDFDQAGDHAEQP